MNITFLIGDHFSSAIGIDLDQEAIQHAQHHFAPPHARFFITAPMALPFKDNSIDGIVCNHVYERLPETSQLVAEAYRVLGKDGLCHFSGGNKYMILGGHYHLPLLSWVSKPLADFYLRLTGKGNFCYGEHLSLRELKGLVSRFQIHNYTLSIIRDPEKSYATDLFNQKDISSRWIRRLAFHLDPWIPTYLWGLTKKGWNDSNISAS